MRGDRTIVHTAFVIRQAIVLIFKGQGIGQSKYSLYIVFGTGEFLMNIDYISGL
jgi:hypothetical protein